MSKTAKETTATDHLEEVAEVALTGAELLASWNYCLANFYARRLQKYWKYPFELAGMRSLEEVARSLIRFETELLSDYADQANELQRIALGKRRRARSAPGQQYEAGLLKAQKDAALIIEQAKAQAERIVSSAKSRAGEMTDREEATPDAARKRA